MQNIKKNTIILIILITLVIITFLLIKIISKNKNIESNKNLEEIKIVTTLYPTYDFAKNIVGDKGDVELLLPLGLEAHSYEPIPGDIIKINNSDIFIYTGEAMEPWVVNIAKQARNERCNYL